jgi:hypothetical protein
MTGAVSISVVEEVAQHPIELLLQSADRSEAVLNNRLLMERR